MLDPPPVIGSAKHKSDAIRQEPSRRLPLGWGFRMEVLMDAEFVTMKVTDGIATITLGTEKRIYIDQETSDGLFTTLTNCAVDPDNLDVLISGH